MHKVWRKKLDKNSFKQNDIFELLSMNFDVYVGYSPPALPFPASRVSLSKR
jgi:hypothetical protein